jgi:hypothetical protein
MQFCSNPVIRSGGRQVCRQNQQTLARLFVAKRIASRLKPFGTALLLLQYTYIFGIGAIAAHAREDRPLQQTSVAQPAAAETAMSQAQNDTPALSPEAQRVSRIALQDGDKTFIMIDKTQGELILFMNGKPAYGAPALTGAGMGDHVPALVLSFTGTHKLTAVQKVTPAGRFTASPEADPTYGRVWTLNEIHGKDWDFAIHRVYLGVPTEHRDARLYSAIGAEHHITYGCVNVAPNTIRVLTRRLPKTGKVPVYILPNDASLIATLFPLRDRHSAPDAAGKSAATTVTNMQPH